MMDGLTHQGLDQSLLPSRLLFEAEVDNVGADVTSTTVIRETFKIYGSVFLGLFALFIVLRSKFPLTFTYNSRSLKYMTPLSKDRHGTFNWIYKIFKFTDDEIFQHCGMSAIVYIRFLRLGLKVSGVGILCSFFLIPANLYGCNLIEDVTQEWNGTDGIKYNETCLGITDNVRKVSFGHLSDSSNSAFATTVAAYVMFGSAMYFIFDEFEWFTKKRHEFLTSQRCDNYSVYVEHIPKEYRTDDKLKAYFEQLNLHVIDAKMVRDIEMLEKKVAERESILDSLEHAVNIRDVEKVEPTITKIAKTGPMKLNAIQNYSQELNSLNQDISSYVDKVAKKKQQEEEIEYTYEANTKPPVDTIAENPFPIVLKEDTPLIVDSLKEDSMKKGHRKGASSLSAFGRKAFETAKAGVGGAVGGVASLALNMFEGEDLGQVRDSGFVTFSSLLAANQCTQSVHYAVPFKFVTSRAPRPEDIVWTNIGKSHKEQTVSTFLAQVATAATCLFWTIPVSFISSFSEVENLTALLPFLEKSIEKNPWLKEFLAMIAPLLLVILTSLLPAILTVFCKKEGHIGSDSLNASLLYKLALFMIIQIFFVQSISGSIFESLEVMLQDNSKIITELAESIPGQAKSFIQFVQVQNFLGCGLELLRVPRVVMALIRNKVGPNLTEEEKAKPFLGILPMSESEELDYPMLFAELILYFMINLVYSSIAPIMSYIMFLAFLVLTLVYRHQLIYTYNRENDDGGQLWASAIMLFITCMLISETVLIGIVLLKKAFIAGILLIPLIIITILFTGYIKQQHFRVTVFAPTTLCASVDKTNGDMDLGFLRSKYVQPALNTKDEYPDNIAIEDVKAYGKKEDALCRENESGDVEFLGAGLEAGTLQPLDKIEANINTTKPIENLGEVKSLGSGNFDDG